MRKEGVDVMAEIDHREKKKELWLRSPCRALLGMNCDTQKPTEEHRVRC